MAELTLTEQEELFVQFLFDLDVNPNRDPDTAKLLAGYDKSVSTTNLVGKLRTSIEEAAKNYLLSRAPKAIGKIEDIMNTSNPVPTSATVIKAAESILDRGGISRKEVVQVDNNTPVGYIILPALAYNEHTTRNQDETGNTE